jgi:hypothetical protein
MILACCSKELRNNEYPRQEPASARPGLSIGVTRRLEAARMKQLG